MRRMIVTACLLVAMSATAYAKDNTGRFGVGADTTLGVSNAGAVSSSGLGDLSGTGLSLIYQASKVFGIQGIVKFTNVASTASGSDAAATDVGIAVRGRYGFAVRGDLNLHLFGGLAYESASADNDMGDQVFSASDFLIEVGVQPEWFVTNYLSFQVGIGLSINLASTDNGGGMGSADDTTVNILGVSQLVGTAGFHFYF